MNIIIRGEILHIILDEDKPIDRILNDKIEDRNEHEVEVHIDKNNHIVSIIITEIKFEVQNIKSIIQNIKETFSVKYDDFPAEDLIPISAEIEKDHNIRFRINRI